ncbi:MAG: hypothetical protein AUH33_04180 [Chloroflexi bacterium 13_1_40CM_68_21]|nr:MAG: hypothetical protein AUH33_04180 [Chloroflexi bacterium 13_1_40CM_68_21]
MRFPLTPVRNVPALLPDVLRIRQDLRSFPNPGIQLRPARPRRRPGQVGALPGELEVGAVVGLPAAPSARTWPFHLSIAINTRSTLISPQFTAPAIIKRFRATTANSASPEGGLGLLWAIDDGGAQTSGAGANVPSGVPVFDTISSPAGGVGSLDEFKQVFSELNTGQTESITDIPLDYLVGHDGAFFLKVTGRALAGGGYDLKGFVTLLQFASLEDAVKYYYGRG